MKKIITISVFLCCVISLIAQDLSGVRIYINPGHGGYDSDDRNVAIYPYASHDTLGFWESKSNLHKGMQLKSMLDSAGATTSISRTQNRTVDDLSLTVIVAAANSFNADYMLSIHSNAGVLSNHVLMLYSGMDPGDSYAYSHMPLYSDVSRAISTVIAQNLYSNQVNCWGNPYAVRGDKTFARQVMSWNNGYGVLRWLNVPGVISEGSMHDYIPETYRLMNMDYKWLEAWHFYKSFCTYFRSDTIPTGVIAGSVRDGFNKILFPEFAKIRNSRDELLPLNGSVVYLTQGNDTLQKYTVDSLYNGFFLFKDLQPGTYELLINANNYYSQSRQIMVTANNVSYANIDMNMVRSTPPVVVSHLPAPAVITDSVEVATPILLHFNWDMEPVATAAAFSITPHVDGTITFENSQKTLRFTPDEPLLPNTNYQIRLTTAACHPDTAQNNHLAADFVLDFRTMNRSRLSILLNYPAHGETNVDEMPSFVLLFDKKINTSNLTTANLPNLIKVRDAQGNLINVSSRTLLRNTAPQPYGSLMFDLVSSLSPNIDYTLILGEAITDEAGVTLVDSVMIPFRTGNFNTVSHPIINTFDSVSYIYAADKSISTASGSVIRNTSKKRFGAACNEIKYAFNAFDGEAMFNASDPSRVANNTHAIGAYVYGDFSFNEVWLVFSVDGDIQYAQLAVLNYAGWKYLETDLNDYLPAGVDYQLVGLKIVRRSSILSRAGAIYLDNMMFYQKHTTGLTNHSMKSRITVFPNPASDRLMVETDEQLYSVELYTLTGICLKKEFIGQISVQDIKEGIYLLKVTTKSSTTTQQVVIKR